MSRPDPIREGLARGWRVRQGADVREDTLSCDVAIVGSGAGAGITAELLARAGLDVIVVEEGPLRSSTDFHQRESEAYPQLYQDSAARKTADKAINILQGRCVGGSTTVNWTSSFRTPGDTLAHWRSAYGLADYDDAALAPWFDQAERRLGIGPWLPPPNENNEALRRGAQVLGIPAASIARNVRNCWNLGSCGMGCPTNAKQSMLVTTLPAALEAGARMLVQMRARRYRIEGGRVQSLECVAVGLDGAEQGDHVVRIQARHHVLAGGAINSPGVLLRSDAPDPHELVGTRTFLHPVVLSTARFAQRIEGWAGAPQTIYTDHFVHGRPFDGPIGFKLEAPPLHPVIAAATLAGHGLEQAAHWKEFPHTQVLIALLRDGFHPESPGGRVQLRGDGTPVVDYPLTDYVMAGAREAYLRMAEIQFAAGAESVMPIHEAARPYARWIEAKHGIEGLPMKPYQTRVVSAHVMGGCAMAADAARGVVRPDGTHWQIANLSVHDGSIFPTSIGANPQLSIYGIVNRLATQLAQRLGARAVTLA